jgi:hypothetical protein
MQKKLSSYISLLFVIMFSTTTKPYTSSPLISVRKISSISKPKSWNVQSSTNHFSLGLTTSPTNLSVSCRYSSENGSHSQRSSIQVYTWFFILFLWFFFVLSFDSENPKCFHVCRLVVNNSSHTPHVFYVLIVGCMCVCSDQDFKCVFSFSFDKNWYWMVSVSITHYNMQGSGLNLRFPTFWWVKFWLLGYLTSKNWY